MNEARRRLAEGLRPEDADAFEAFVSGAIATVDEACRVHGVRPESLRRPTYRAYRYLTQIDMDRLPQRGDRARQGVARPAGPRVRGLVSACRSLRPRLTAASVAEGSADRSDNAADQRRALLSDIRQLTTKVDRTCASAGFSPGDLPAPSRRWHAWLACLSDEAHLDEHLATLRVARSAAGAVQAGRLRPDLRALDLAVIPMAPLYRGRGARARRTVDLNACLTGAPVDVLRAAVRGAMGLGRSSDLAVVRAYAAGPRATALAARLAGPPPTLHTAQGRQYDLATIARRVRDHLLPGLALPGATWSAMPTHRKLAHYDAVTDTMVVSPTLDDPRVPAYVVEFVVYHEMLHKALGIPTVNGRKQAHTAAFRRAERRHPEAEAAIDFLSRMHMHLDL